MFYPQEEICFFLFKYYILPDFCKKIFKVCGHSNYKIEMHFNLHKFFFKQFVFTQSF